MKVAVATNNGKTLALHAGRCKSFHIYQVDENGVVKIEERHNPHLDFIKQEIAAGRHRPGSHHHDDHHHDRGLGRGLGRGSGRGLGRGMGRGLGRGSGRGLGRGMGRGFGPGETWHDHEHLHHHEETEHGHSLLFETIRDCDVLLAASMGRGIVDEARARGIRPVLTKQRDIAAALDALRTGTLVEDGEVH